MAIAFPRSLRALNNDRYRPSLFALGITTGLLLVWLGWFFFGRISIYESTTTFTLKRGGIVSAVFTPEQLERIEPEQKATLRVNDSDDSSTTFEGQVSKVVPARGETPGTAEIVLENAPAPPSSSNSGQGAESVEGEVQVEVETILPATLLLRAVRQAAPSLAPAAPAAQPTP